MKHRIELIVECDDSHMDVTDWVLDAIWSNLDCEHEDAYIIYSEETDDDDD